MRACTTKPQTALYAILYACEGATAVGRLAAHANPRPLSSGGMSEAGRRTAESTIRLPQRGGGTHASFLLQVFLPLVPGYIPDITLKYRGEPEREGHDQQTQIHTCVRAAAANNHPIVGTAGGKPGGSNTRELFFAINRTNLKEASAGFNFKQQPFCLRFPSFPFFISSKR